MFTGYPKIRFPVALTIDEGNCFAIKSTTWLRPGVVAVCSLGHPLVVLEKNKRTLITQSLEDGTIGTQSIYDAKRWWKICRGVCFPDIVWAWKKLRKDSSSEA